MKIVIFCENSTDIKDICKEIFVSGYKYDVFHDEKNLFKRLHKEGYDMVIVHVHNFMLKYQNFLTEIRTKVYYLIPAIVISNDSTEGEVVGAFEAGADDFLVNPIRPRELIARVKALFRRSYLRCNENAKITVNNYVFEPLINRVTVSGDLIEMRPREFKLALLLFCNFDRALSREYILRKIWKSESNNNIRSIDSHIARIRLKLFLIPKNGYKLAPVYGYGYRLSEVNKMIA
ncbi:response regulator transcription factor [Glaciimonas sp. PAMC28666]|uniref:response regulator transcription factor n=1 Tax=Glaciimonas sp. PAMC28666 TaxID=2807626 RepID=UPI0019636A11|nr:response regulator transcription factor [Glaciimonas sp. PAMC28666]QRX83434.1 response regulator transcription factor [Glaciimonas sp. PAMC28666]